MINIKKYTSDENAIQELVDLIVEHMEKETSEIHSIEITETSITCTYTIRCKYQYTYTVSTEEDPTLSNLTTFSLIEKMSKDWGIHQYDIHFKTFYTAWIAAADNYTGRYSEQVNEIYEIDLSSYFDLCIKGK